MNFTPGFSFESATGEQTRASLDQLVSQAKFAPGSGVLDQVTIADNGLGVASIKDAGITSAKIASGAVTADKIASGAITADKIAAGAISPAKLSGAQNATASVIVSKSAAHAAGAWRAIASVEITPRKLNAKIVVLANFDSDCATAISTRLVRDSAVLCYDEQGVAWRTAYVYLDQLDDGENQSPQKHTYSVQVFHGALAIKSPLEGTDNSIVLLEV